MYTEGGGASYTPSSNKKTFQSPSSSRVLFSEYWTIPLGRMRQRNAHTSGKENVGRKENPLSRRNTSVIGSNETLRPVSGIHRGSCVGKIQWIVY